MPSIFTYSVVVARAPWAQHDNKRAQSNSAIVNINC